MYVVGESLYLHVHLLRNLGALTRFLSVKELHREFRCCRPRCAGRVAQQMQHSRRRGSGACEQRQVRTARLVAALPVPCAGNHHPLARYRPNAGTPACRAHARARARIGSPRVATTLEGRGGGRQPGSERWDRRSPQRRRSAWGPRSLAGAFPGRRLSLAWASPGFAQGLAQGLAQASPGPRLAWASPGLAKSEASEPDSDTVLYDPFSCLGPVSPINP